MYGRLKSVGVSHAAFSVGSARPLCASVAGFRMPRDNLNLTHSPETLYMAPRRSVLIEGCLQKLAKSACGP